MLPEDGRVRVVVEGVRPEVDCGTFPAKRIVGDFVTVEADISTDGHDSVAGEVLYRYAPEEDWRRAPMTSIGNDRWRGGFPTSAVGKCYYTVEGWIDRFVTWRNAMIKRIDSRTDVRAEWLIGASLVEEAASRATPDDATRLRDWVRIARAEAGFGERQARNPGRRTRSHRAAIPRSPFRAAVWERAQSGCRPGEGRLFGLV